MRGDRSYEIAAAAAEQTSFAEFGQDFNRLGTAAYAPAESDCRGRVLACQVLSDGGGLRPDVKVLTGLVWAN